MRPNGVADGKLVNIPAPADGDGSQSSRTLSDESSRKGSGPGCRELDGEVSRNSPAYDRTKTDTGRRGEYPKALERTAVKELGKITP